MPRCHLSSALTKGKCIIILNIHNSCIWTRKDVICTTLSPPVSAHSYDLTILLIILPPRCSIIQRIVHPFGPWFLPPFSSLSLLTVFAVKPTLASIHGIAHTALIFVNDILILDSAASTMTTFIKRTIILLRIITIEATNVPLLTGLRKKADLVISVSHAGSLY